MRHDREEYPAPKSSIASLTPQFLQPAHVFDREIQVIDQRRFGCVEHQVVCCEPRRRKDVADLAGKLRIVQLAGEC